MQSILGVFLLFLTVQCALRKHKPCINGEQEENKCFCHDGWTGASCHRKMNCDGFERRENGSCVECSLGWSGADCDTIDCHGRGTPNYDFTNCTCDKPFSGVFCETFKTTDIYSYYNNMASRTGAYGILTIIPLIFIYLTCEKCARGRQQRRVEHHLTGTLIRPDRTLDRLVVAHLLANHKEKGESV